MSQEETLSNIAYICQEPRIFSLPEAQSLVALLQRITHKHETIVRRLVASQQYLVKSGAPNAVLESFQDGVNNELLQWAIKIKKLGCMPLPGCSVGIDAGGYYWSWKYNETKVEHYHMYSEDPMYRRHLSVKYDQK